jgi:ADP-ribose pyrophosphatase YjhB (NUDIX family)
MEQREHPRVQLPLLVELQHPALNPGRSLKAQRSAGSLRCLARDISEGGVFVHLDVPAAIKPGAKLRLTLLNPTSVENQPTPTVEMVVKRVEDDGLGMAFINNTGRHLWQSVERLRDELAVGRDYFQIYQSALVVNRQGQLLIVQQHGKWSYPGDYLIVGEDWQAALKGFLARTFDLTDVEVMRVLSADSGGSFDLPEAAVFKTFVLANADSSQFTLDTQHESTTPRRYRNARWIDAKKDVEELTFVSEQLRQLAHEVLDLDGTEPSRETD